MTASFSARAWIALMALAAPACHAGHAHEQNGLAAPNSGTSGSQEEQANAQHFALPASDEPPLHTEASWEGLQPQHSNVCFDDVIGAQGAKDALKNLVALMADGNNPLGARPPKGIVLVGEPGVGKTMLAKATAKHAQVPFFAVTGAQLVQEGPNGSAVQRMQQLFATVRAQAPAILFIDEFDVITGSAPGDLFGRPSHQELSKQLGVELDGFLANEQVFVIAAANSLQRTDKSLLRPGRFDVVVEVAKPNRFERSALLQHLARNTPQADDVDWVTLSRHTAHLSGAALRTLANTATLRAYLARRTAVSADDWDQALDDVLVGPEDQTRVVDDDSRWQTAVHEAGHAMVGAFYRSTHEVRKVSVKGRSGALGFTTFVDDESLSHDSTWYENEVAIDLGGAAAERYLLPGGASDGVSQDLQNATDTARTAVMQLGMGNSPDAEGQAFENLYAFPKNLGSGNKIKDDVDTMVSEFLTSVSYDVDELFQQDAFISATLMLAKQLYDETEVSGEDVQKWVLALPESCRGEDRSPAGTGDEQYVRARDEIARRVQRKAEVEAEREQRHLREQFRATHGCYPEEMTSPRSDLNTSNSDNAFSDFAVSESSLWMPLQMPFAPSSCGGESSFLGDVTSDSSLSRE